MGGVRNFLHKMVDVLCDIFKKAWDYMVSVVKAIVRFVGRAVDFFHGLYKSVWNAITSGAKTIYVFMFGDPDVTSTDEEMEINNLLGNLIYKANEEETVNVGNIGITKKYNKEITKENLMLAVIYDNIVQKVDDRSFMAIDVDSGVSDPGMANTVKSLKNDRRSVKVGKLT